MVARKEVTGMTKMERFAQLDELLAEQDGMLQTSQVVAKGIVKPNMSKNENWNRPPTGFMFPKMPG